MNGKSEKSELIGREKESAQIRACIQVGRNILLEGPVGVGKTQLALAITQSMGRNWIRVDGDSRFTEQKLAGWFDPPSVMKKGFTWESYFQGPLVEAMKTGAILFINEFNRLPEGVQNLLLPAIDERMIQIPRLGEVRAAPGFVVIATQNPKDFVATTHLSEAILDRFEWIQLGYQAEAEEKHIVLTKLKRLGSVTSQVEHIAEVSVRVARLTRHNSKISRGASVRAAISVAELTLSLLKQGQVLKDAFMSAVMMALPTRIEMDRTADSTASSIHEELEALIQQLVAEALSPDTSANLGSEKKK